MASPYLGEIRVTSFGFAPKGWALCNGQLLSIQQNQALFAIVGTTYGGNGVTTFGLPNLQGRVPMHWNASYPIGAAGGEEVHALTTTELPAHNHEFVASTAVANSANPSGALLAVPPTTAPPVYAPKSHVVALNPQAVGATGAGQPHENRQPYLGLNFIIALQGIFPSQG